LLGNDKQLKETEEQKKQLHINS